MRTYPVPARKGIEVSCTAGLTESGDWVRLFPVPYRTLKYNQKFHKYQWISVELTKAKSDPRPESYTPNLDSIKVLDAPLSSRDRWRERAKYVLPKKAPSLCDLKRQRDDHGSPTLGIFKPKTIRRLKILTERAKWTAAELGKLRQASFFSEPPPEELEKIPYKFVYEFECDELDCPSHNLSCTDWEMGEAYRQWSAKYGNDWKEKFRDRFETEMIEDNDTHFFVGTVNNHPTEWIIVGLWYPKKTLQATMF